MHLSHHKSHNHSRSFYQQKSLNHFPYQTWIHIFPIFNSLMWCFVANPTKLEESKHGNANRGEKKWIRSVKWKERGTKMRLPETRGADQNSPVVGVHGCRRRRRIGGGWTVCIRIAAEMGGSDNQQEKCSEREQTPHLLPLQTHYSTVSLEDSHGVTTTAAWRLHWVDSDEGLEWCRVGSSGKGYRMF